VTEPVVAVLGQGRVSADTPILRADDLGVLRGDGVFDGLRSNRDYSRTIVMGRLNITATSPKIRGTISSLRVIGDGFPSLSNSEGYVQNVVFCIDP